MKKLLPFVSVMFLFAATSFAQVTVSGAVGGNGTYGTLSVAGGAFAAINGTVQTGANIVITITSNVTTETGAIALSSGTWASLTINPSGGLARTVSGTATTPLIKLNGASNVTIDGLNTGGNSLTITNQSTSATAGASTIAFLADASNDVVKNCTILGSTTGAPGATSATATILVGAGTTSGCDNIQILNNNIGPYSTSYPTIAIGSWGLSGSASNDNATVTGNNIYDYFATTGATGVNVGSNSSGWNISSNKFYQTVSRSTLTAGSYLKAIYVNTSAGSGYAINSNIIGYATSSQTGMLTNSGGRFTGIELAAVAASPISNIQGNTINGITWTTSTSASTLGTATFNGIIVSAGGVNIGTSSANIIGATSGTGSSSSNIYVTTTSSGSGIYPIYVTSSTTCSISGNTIGAIATGGAAAMGYSFYGIAIAGSGSHTVNNNTIGNATANSIAIGTSGTTTAQTNIIAIYSTATGTTVSIGNTTGTGNLIQNNSSFGSSTSSQFYGIDATGAVGTLNMNYNTFTANTLAGGGLTAGTIYYTNLINGGAVTSAININNNTINSGTISIATYGGSAGFIYNLAGASTATLSISNNNMGGLSYTGATGGTGTFTGINEQTGTPVTEVISGNNFNNLSIKTSGSIYLIYNSYVAPASGTKTIQNNSVVTGFSRTATAAGSFYCYYDGSASPSTVTETISGNTFSNLTTNTSGSYSFYGIYCTSTNNPNRSVYNNTISTVTFNGNTSVYGIYLNGLGGTSGTPNAVYGNTFSGLTCSGTASIYGLYIGATNLYVNAYNNTIQTFTLSGASTVYGIYGSGSTNAVNFYNNTVTGISNSAAGTIYGIYNVGGTLMNYYQNYINSLSSAGNVHGVFVSSGTAVNIYQQQLSGGNNYSIYGITSSGAATVANGITVNGGTSVYLYKNNIYNISNTSAGSTVPLVNGMLFSAGTNVKAYNNIIGNLTASSSTYSDAIRGISVTSTTTSANYNIYYNTVYLSGTGAAGFGTTGLFHAASSTATTAALDLRDNIIVNGCTPGTGGTVVAYRRSAGTATMLANYASTSNNNLFYAGTPGANNLIYSDGTSTAQTISAYKNGAFTAGTIAPRDAVSVSENPTWVSTNGSDATYLHINTTTPTQIESAGAPVSGITDDFDGDTRNGSTPDIGADEFAGIGVDLTPPSITYTTITNNCTFTDRTLAGVTISDATGVPTTGSLVPRIYYKKNSNPWVSQPGTLTAGNGISGTWSFTILAADMGGLASNDVISYYVIAQDVAPTNNITSNPAAGLVATDVNTVSTPPTTPNTTQVLPTMSGTILVGTGNYYTTLTAAINAYNTACLSGAVTFSLTDASYGASETFPITILANPQASVTNTLTISPASGTGVTLTGSSGTPLVDFNGADYVTIDGVNSGGSSLTISNTSTAATANTCTIRYIADATNNTVTNCSVLGSSTMALGTNGGNILFSTGTTTGNDNNTISYCKIGPAGSNLPSMGICANGSTGSSALANSTINITNCEIYDFFLTGGCAGIYALTGNTAWTIQNNKIYESASRTFTGTGTLNGIYFANATYGDNIQITGNTIGYASNSGTGTFTLLGSGVAGSFQGIYLSALSTAATTCNVNNNIISDISLTSASGTFYGIYNATAASSNTININSNQVKNIAVLTSTSTVVGIYTGAATTLNCNSNTLDNISRNTGGAFYGIQYASPTTVTFNGNTIKNLSSTSISSTSNFYALYSGSSPVTENIIGNNIFNISSSSTGAQSIYGWYNNTVAGTKTIQNNNIYSISAAGGATITGIKLALGTTVEISGNSVYTLSGGLNVYGINIGAGTTTNVFRNKVYDLSSANANATVYGLYISAGTTINLYNNIVGDLRATAAAATIPVVGIYASSGTTVNIYYNTVNLNASSSASPFGSAALYASTTPTVNLRNNILVNTSTPAGATGFTAAYRRSGTTLTTYASTSNNNLFYAGTPGTYNLIMYDGTTSYQTLAAYKAAVASRDSYSVTENPTWASTNGSDPTYLHINTTTPTQIESGAAPIDPYTTDFDGDTRNVTTPDIGADEFNGVMLDMTAPVITYTTLSNSCGGVDRTLAGVTISDASGVPTTGSLVPRIYYRKASGTWYSQPGTLTAGGSTSGTWSFQIVAADMGGLATNDVVSYYVIAQDIASPANIGSNPSAGLVATDVNTVATAPTSPNTYTVISSLTGTYTVGTSGNYTTLTLAVAAYNASCINGPVIFSLTDATYSASETFPITINANATASGTNTLTIKPAASNNVAITGLSTTALILLNGADYVTIDGSNGSTANVVCPASAATRNLTLTNSGSGTSSAVIWMQTATADGATNNVVKNCNLAGSGNTQTLFGVGSGSSTIGTSSLGTGNNNNSFINNNISKTQYGIYSQGASAGSKNSGTTINQNLINTASPNNVAKGGIQVGFENNITISGNSISGMTQSSSPDVFGIAAGLTALSNTTFSGNEVTNATISNNVIGVVTNTGTFSAGGITLATATSGTTTISNNMISGVGANGTSGDFAAGIILGGGTGSTTNIFFNTVTMSTILTGGNQNTFALAVGGTTPTVNIKNNILTATGSNGTGINYAIGLAYSSTTGNYVGLTSDNNDLFASGTSAGVGETGLLQAGTARTTLANWTTETGRDGASKNANHTFLSATDLHIDVSVLSNGTYFNGTAAPGTGVTVDIDCDTRDSSTPDIGADEFSTTTCAGAVGGTASGTTSFCNSGTPTITATGYSIGIGSAYQWQYSNDNFATDIHDFAGQTNPAALTTGAVTATTNYRLKVTCTSGQATDYSTPVITVTIKPTPTASASGNTPICAGGTLNLTCTTNIANTFSWSGPNGYNNTTQNPSLTPVTVLASGVYTVTATLNGCSVTASTPTITVNAQPTAVTITPASATIPAGTIQSLAATGGTSSGDFTFGTGGSSTTGSSTTSPLGPNPMQNYYGGTKQQCLYTAAELTLAGMSAGTISAIKVNMAVADNTYSLLSFTVKMGNTLTGSYATTSSWVTSGLSVVRNSATLVPQNGLNTLTFDTPFTWDGTSNLVVEMTYSNNNGGEYTLNNSAYYTATSFTSTLFYRVDNTAFATIDAYVGAANYSYLARTDVVFSAVSQSPITWSPTTSLYTDAGAGSGYTGTPQATVWTKPNATITYTATATSGTGCTNTKTVLVTVTPSWTGATNTNWGTSTNWSSNAIPGPSDDVTIPAVSNLPIINEDPGTPATCHNITIKNNASVTVAPGKAFTVSGTVTNSATPGIIIQSDATGSGSMIFNTTSISGTMDRFISHWTDDSHGWHFLSSPVASQAIQPLFVPATPDATEDFYAWDETNNWWYNSKDGNMSWVSGFDASFIPGKGYLVAYLTNVTKTFTGTFNVANVPKSGLTNTPGPYGGNDITPGWNLLGNPFTSALIWNNGAWSLNNIATVAKIWTENYASYSDIDINTGGIIPATQGFMVNVTDVAGGSLTIPAAARTHSTQNWYKSTGIPCIKLLAHNLAAQTAQESTVMFNNQATAGYSPAFDCRFFPGYAPQFYSVDGSEHLSTNVLPSLDNQTIIPFNFIKTTGVNYSIEATKIDNIEGQVYLTDLKLDKTQNLADNPVYTFTAAAGDNPSRFVLSFSHVGIGENTTGKNGIYSYGNNLYIVNPGVARLEVFNLTGQKLLAEEISSTVLFRKMLFVPTGYYVVRLTTGTKVVVTKVFIQS